MKEVAEFAAWGLLIIAMVFLFKGEPSLFDVLRGKAMQSLQEKTND